MSFILLMILFHHMNYKKQNIVGLINLDSSLVSKLNVIDLVSLLSRCNKWDFWLVEDVIFSIKGLYFSCLVHGLYKQATTQNKLSLIRTKWEKPKRKMKINGEGGELWEGQVNLQMHPPASEEWVTLREFGYINKLIV